MDRIYFTSGSASGVALHSNATTLNGLLTELNASASGTLISGNIGNQTYVVESLHTTTNINGDDTTVIAIAGANHAVSLHGACFTVDS